MSRARGSIASLLLVLRSAHLSRNTLAMTDTKALTLHMLSLSTNGVRLYEYAGSERLAMQIAVQNPINQEKPAHAVKPSPPVTTFGSQRMPWEELYWRPMILNTDDTGNTASPDFGKNLDDWRVEIQHQEWNKIHRELD